MQANLIVTKKVRERIVDWSKDEHAFFAMQQMFDIHIEKKRTSDHEIAIVMYFDNTTNKKLASKLDGRIMILDCVMKYDGFVATNIRAVHGQFPLKTNRRLSLKLQFNTKPNAVQGMPLELHTKIRELPIAEERSEYVKKRIASWEGYLKIQEQHATIEDITATFSRMDVNADFSRMTLVCNDLKKEQWSKLKGLSVHLKGSKDSIGDVLKVNASKKTVEIELRTDIQERIRRNTFNMKTKEIVFSNFATLSQIRRLRKGFADLEKGLAANANLEKILFEDRPRIRAPKQQVQLQFHNPLNEFQRQAVIGAMTAEDLYVIQGPPGTGKTTVISEICQQNAKAGLRTLVASQSNLAVDNALSRLLSNKDIRILRFGRTESIEEEGKKFIEENVGQYWLEQTLYVIEQEIDEHPIQQQKLEQQLYDSEQRLKKLVDDITTLQLNIAKQEGAKEEKDVLEINIQQLKKSLSKLKKEKQQYEQAISKTESEWQELQQHIEQLEQQIQQCEPLQQLQQQLQCVEEAISQYAVQMDYQQVMEKQQQAKQALQNVCDQYDTIHQQIQQINNIVTQIEAFPKLEQLTAFIEQHHIVETYAMTGQLKKLATLQQQLQAFTSWREVNSRLNAAIDYVENIVNKRLHHTTPLQNAVTISEIEETLQQLKQWLRTHGIANHQQLTMYLQKLYTQRVFVWQQGTAYQQLRQDIMEVFCELKKGVAEQFVLKVAANPQTLQTLQHQRTKLEADFQQLQQQATTLQLKITTQPIQSLQHLQHLQQLKKEEHHALFTKIETLKQAHKELQHTQAKALPLQQHITSMHETLQQLTAQIKQLNTEGLQDEARYKQLQQIVQQPFKQQLQQAEHDYDQLTLQMTQLEQHLQKLPTKQAIQRQWHTLLQQANDHDLDEIRKLYVQHANVIGTTCVASARKEFMDNYPTFDVVIIDEVSKATPPELLLPMLKGRKIILVGDHHQLPPLVGEDTLEETLKAMLEENSELEGRDELKKLLKESLFERLFKNLPRSNKQMLAIQYRMHENIMRSIAPFYEQEDDHLQCGLEDSDVARDHLLDSHYVKRQDHLIWLDMPNDKPFFEEQMKDGKSRFNQAELDVIRDVLLDLDHATETAKKSGLLPQQAKKSIGVISFYGEQVKKIDRLLQQQLQLKHLHLRTGTVDKFQGMEMDVIIVSMVRNNNHKHADIGFASDYRRLNVALSRARELLLLIGSTTMFTERAKQPEAREMYQRLLATVKQQQGLRTMEGTVIGG